MTTAQEPGTQTDATAALPPAKPADTLSATDLASAIAFANAQAAQLNQQLMQAQPSPDTPAPRLQDLRHQRDAFMRMALEMAASTVRLHAGEARITAEHVASAIAAAQAGMNRITSLQRRLQTGGVVLDFLAAVLSGRGHAIVAQAQRLKATLDESSGA